MKVCGIDPGLSGAIAIYDTETLSLILYDMPIIRAKKAGKGNKNVISIAGIRRIINEEQPDKVFVEKVHAMPGQGVTSMFNMGYGLGVIHACVASAGTSLIEVTPQAWKRKLMNGQPKDKSAACIVASNLFPNNAEDFYTPRGKALDGRADAALIAYYGSSFSE